PHGLLHGIGAHFGIVRSKSSVAENGMEKERHRGHWDDNAVFRARLLELADNAVAFGRCCINRNQIVVVQIYSPCADFGQHGNDLTGTGNRADKIPKWVTSPVANS